MKNHIVTAIISVVLAVVASVAVIPAGHDTIREVQTRFGAASPDFSSQYVSWGNVRNWASRQDMYTASTTQCAMVSPSSTSTLMYASAKFDVSSTTAMTVAMYKSATPFAQTTQIGSSVALSANGKGFILASTTAAQQASGVNVFAPNTYLVVFSTGGTGTYSPVGSCQAQWIEHF